MGEHSAVQISTECATPDATIEAGRRLGERLEPGDVVLLSGDLGVGKTTLAQGIVAGYGIAEPVTSPSFALIHEYRLGPRLVVHFDPYRLEAAGALRDVGWEEYLGSGALMLIEWPERLGDSIPVPHIWVTIAHADGSTRRITLVSEPDTDIDRWSNLWTA